MQCKNNHFLAHIEIYCSLFLFFFDKRCIFAQKLREKVMILEKISVLNYKNIAQSTLEFSDNINCFIGQNGEGKTNILDAVYYLSFCRSSNNPIDSQVIRHDEQMMMVEGTYRNYDEEAVVVTCGIKRGQKKIFKRNQKAYKRLSEHIGFIPLVLVTPQDSILVDGGSEERRHFMDIVIAQYDRQYIEYLNNYNKALQQRNVLLKMEEEPDAMLLDIWEREMARNGEEIFRRRKSFIDIFIPYFEKIHELISDNNEQVEIQYISHCQRGALLDVIQRDRIKDRAVGYSLHGIHRDELDMKLGGYQLKREGSQGQIKTFVLAMKMAQFEFLKNQMSQTTPILLLDDIFDKLDAKRVEKIVQKVSTGEYGQIFITDTNRSHLDQILSNINEGYKIFYVQNGVITEKNQE